jgi:hypothetical protein
MSYVKTTAAMRREQVKLRYVHVSEKGALPALRNALQRIVAVITPQRAPPDPLGMNPVMEFGRRSRNGTTKGAFGTGRPAGSKFHCKGRYAKPRGY